jgi:DNA ligase-1
MNSNQIYGIISKIAGESSKNEKVAILKTALVDADFKRVIVAALDPLTTYGIAARPCRGGSGSDIFTETTWQMLHNLSVRGLTGDNAISTVTMVMDLMTLESAELLWRIISKDLKAGFGESSVNKAVKGTIKDFPYMRCCLPKDAKIHTFTWAEGVYSQEKADGTFANLDVEGTEVRITTRQGNQYPNSQFGQLIDAALYFLPPNSQSHGELLVYQDGVCLERSISNGIMNSIREGGVLEAGQVIHYFAWDNIPLEMVQPKGTYNQPYRARFNLLNKCIGGLDGQLRLIDTRIVHTLAEAYVHYRDMLKLGKEGVVIKNGTAIWKDGTSKEQVKLKLEADVDLKVVAINPGKEGSKVEGRPGALACVTSCGKLRVDVTVKNEAMRDDIEANPEKYLEGILVVRANAIMEPSASSEVYSLFLPRMVEDSIRSDKTEADSLQRVRDQFEAAKEAA